RNATLTLHPGVHYRGLFGVHREAQRFGFELEVGAKVQVPAQSLSHGAYFEIGNHRLGVERSERDEVQHHPTDAASDLLRPVLRIHRRDHTAEVDGWL